MTQDITVTGMILAVQTIKDYDKRLVLLTKERGRISVFANGAKRPNSPLSGVSEPFLFGEFILREGQNSYSLKSANIKKYYEDLKKDLEKVYYGYYFCEFASWLTRENNDEAAILLLLYMTMSALEKGAVPATLIRCIYEIKILALAGYAMESFQCIRCGRKEQLAYFNSSAGGVLCEDCGSKESSLMLGESTLYTIQYIISSPLQKLYSFLVKDSVLRQLQRISTDFRNAYVDYSFKSLDFIDLRY